MTLPMKFHIDRLYDYITSNFEQIDEKAIGYLHGILYEIGSQWEYYKIFFEGED